MKRLLVLAGVVLGVVAVTGMVTAQGFPKTVHYIPHEKVEAAFVKGARIIEEPGLIVIANRGQQRGAEMHEWTNHVFIIVEGEADFVTGGKMKDPKTTAPGETRGGDIEGGTLHHVTKGDVITIPAKMAHQWKDTSKTGSIAYYAVNVITK
jgi:mannose-6-phosphate isomerase-like protein (cupin superfamily)